MDKKLPSSLHQTFRRLRRSIRRYVFVQGCAILLIHLGLLFWLSLVLDRFFEPSVAVRQVVLGVIGVFLLWDVWHFLLRPLCYPLTNHTLGILLERRFQTLNDTLLTVLEPEDSDSEWHQTMLARTQEKLDQALKGVKLSQLFRFGPVVKHVLLALLLVGSVVGLALSRPDLFQVWQSRVISMSEVRWPRTFVLELDGFQNGTVKVARGSDLELRARVSLADEAMDSSMFSKLRTVYLTYREKGGSRHQVAMIREGQLPEAGEAPRPVEYTHLFSGVLNSFTFDITASDASLRQLSVEVVDSPTIANMTLELQYPAYAGLETRRLPVSGVMAIPEGATVVVHAQANKPLVSVRVSDVRGEQETPLGEVSLEKTETPREFTWTIEKLAEDQTLFFRLLDTDGLESRVPTKLMLAKVDDVTPEVAVQPKGIGTAITANARIPVVGKITDDYGIAKVEFDYRVNRLDATEADGLPFDPSGTKPSYQLIAEYEGNPTEVTLDGTGTAVLELESLGLKEKDGFQVSVVAHDRYDLTSAIRRGAGQPTVLEVVSPERLRLLIEAREIVLRQLYEVIRQEVLDSRASLADVQVDASDSKPADGTTGDASVNAGTAAGDANAGADGTPAPKLGGNVEEAQSSRGLQCYRVERVIQNNRKNSHEINGIVEGIENCAGQIVNNRIDTPEWLERLQVGIQQPLENVHEKAFPDLELTLTKLREAIEQGRVDEAKPLHTQALKEIDALILTLDLVLEKMSQMQDFNEVVESLRSLIRSQEELQESVKKKQRESLLDLED